MDVLGTQEEREHVRTLLRKKYGTLEKAAAKMKLSKFTLSRILGGHYGELTSLVKILTAAGYLQARKYRYPKDDLSTFYYLNGILDVDLLGNAKKGGKNGR